MCKQIAFCSCDSCPWFSTDDGWDNKCLLLDKSTEDFPRNPPYSIPILEDCPLPDAECETEHNPDLVRGEK